MPEPDLTYGADGRLTDPHAAARARGHAIHEAIQEHGAKTVKQALALMGEEGRRAWAEALKQASRPIDQAPTDG